MPYPNEWAFSQVDSRRFAEFRRVNDGFGTPGIDVVYGVYAALGPRSGRTVVQSLRFRKALWSLRDAKSWLRRHGFATDER